jgi:segregation and condensation protein B
LHTLPLKTILEAAIMASHSPMTIEQLSELFEEAQRPTHNELAQALESLSLDCAERGVELVEVASGFRFQIKAAAHALVSRLWTERQSKYSRALLETLALIAYRQPITRAEIEAVRGVAVSSHIVRTLEEREWIRVVGHREVPGRPALYGTTRGFLDYFKLKSLEDLPTLSEIKDIDEMAPELEFPSLDGAPSEAAQTSSHEASANAAAPVADESSEANNTSEHDDATPEAVQHTEAAELSDADAVEDAETSDAESNVEAAENADTQTDAESNHFDPANSASPELDLEDSPDTTPESTSELTSDSTDADASSDRDN